MSITDIVPISLVDEYEELKHSYSSTAKYSNARRYFLKKIQQGMSCCKKEELIFWRNFQRIALRDLSK